jgi:hypothetical protein
MIYGIDERFLEKRTLAEPVGLLSLLRYQFHGVGAVGSTFRFRIRRCEPDGITKRLVAIPILGGSFFRILLELLTDRIGAARAGRKNQESHVFRRGSVKLSP